MRGRERERERERENDWERDAVKFVKRMDATF